jgi:peptide/nickel transport system permease protein
MTRYLVQRLLQTLLVLQLLTVLSYYLLTCMPGDPIDQMIAANPRITAADVARLRELHGLDQPFWRRYWHWYRDLVRLELGYSRTYHVPVAQLLGPCLVNTLVLAGAAFVLAVLLAVPLGVWAAVRRNTAVDYGVNLLAFVGISLPSFFLGMILILVFAVWLGWLPAGGTADAGTTGLAALVSRGRHLILPAAALTALEAAVLVRYTRGAMLDTLRQDYIRTARAKGLSAPVVLFRHALRNALIPVVTVLALHLGTLFSGAVILETVFAYHGVGKLVYDAILANDHHVAMVAFLVTMTMVLVMNLAADLLYACLDPRIRYG